MLTKNFKGTGPITLLILRQSRFKIMVWLFSLILVSLAAASSYPEVYQTQEDILAFALTMENPAMVAMIGPGYELADYNTATIFANEMLLFTLIAVAVMNILLVGRTSRADEDDGQMELIRSLPVGRLAYLSASMIMALFINILLASLIGLGLLSLNLEGMNAESSWLYGSILGATGLVFAAITLLLAQLAKNSRGTTGLSFGLLILAYMVRAIGDVSNEALSKLSPFGWATQSYVFITNDWWPISISIVFTIFLLAGTFYLNAIRDMGAGFLPEMKGKAHASRFLQTPLGLAWRLQKMTIISWGIGIFLLSASFGSILGELETYFSDMDILKAYLESVPGTTMAEQFTTFLIAIMSLIANIPVVMSILKLKREENKNRTELLFSRAVSRTNFMGSYFVLAILISILMQTLIALGLWSVGATVMEETINFITTFASAYVYLPAMWVLIGLTLLIIGWIPKFSGLIWLYVVYCLIVLYLGGVFNFPDWLNGVSVFNHVPQIPVDKVNYTLVSVMLLGGVVVSLIGFIGYNKRDITG